MREKFVMLCILLYWTTIVQSADLTTIPIQLCGSWANNVVRVLNSQNSNDALMIWLATAPGDYPVIVETRKWLTANNGLRGETNPWGVANAACINAHGPEDYL